MKTQVLGSGQYKVQDANGNKIELEYPELPPKERTSFNLRGLKHMRDRFKLEDGSSIPVAWSATLQREVGGRLLESHELAAMRKMYDRLPTDLNLLQDCEECNGDGFIGDFNDGTADLCTDCGGYGVQASPLLVDISKALDFLKAPQKKFDEATIAKKNKAGALRREIELKKKKIIEQKNGEFLKAQREQEQALRDKAAAAMEKEKQRLDKELEAALKALDE